MSFEMTDWNLRLVVTIPIHMEAMKVLGRAKRQSRVQEQPYNWNQAKNIQEFDLSVIFARKLQKSHLKMG